jgi:hypothetical protein
LKLFTVVGVILASQVAFAGTEKNEKCDAGVDVVHARITGMLVDSSQKPTDARASLSYKEYATDDKPVSKILSVCPSVMNDPARGVLFGLLAPTATDGKFVDVKICLERTPCIIGATRIDAGPKPTKTKTKR